MGHQSAHYLKLKGKTYYFSLTLKFNDSVLAQGCELLAHCFDCQAKIVGRDVTCQWQFKSK